MRFISGVFALLLCASAASAQAVPDNTGTASQNMPAVLRNVGFEPQLNSRLPLDLAFRDETGRNVQFRDYFNQRPVVLALVYYGCPMLCDQVEQGVVGTLRMLSFKPGRDYDVVFVSFDSRETSEMAAQKKEVAMTHFRRPETSNGWHFLTGSKESVDALTKGANFRYSFDRKSGLFAHASGIMLLTPQGRVAQYYYGIEYAPRDIQLGLIEASKGKIGNVVDQVLLYCYHYDPRQGRYGTAIFNVLRLSALATVLALGGFMLIMFRRDSLAAHKGGLTRTAE